MMEGSWRRKTAGYGGGLRRSSRSRRRRGGGAAADGVVAGRIGKPTFWKARPMMLEQMTCVVRPLPNWSARRRKRRGIRLTGKQELVADVEDRVRPGALRQVLDDLAHALVAVDQDHVAGADDAQQGVEVVGQEEGVVAARLGERAGGQFEELVAEPAHRWRPL